MPFYGSTRKNEFRSTAVLRSTVNLGYISGVNGCQCYRPVYIECSILVGLTAVTNIHLLSRWTSQQVYSTGIHSHHLQPRFTVDRRKRNCEIAKCEKEKQKRKQRGKRIVV